MQNLGDFLGHLMSEITIARMQADIEAIRIAELYASHPLLVHMPVPHFRLPNIDIDVPVIVKAMEEEQPGQPPRGAPVLKEMQNKFASLLDNYIAQESIRLTSAERKNLNSAVEKTFAEFGQPREIAVNIRKVADRVSDVVASALPEQSGASNKAKVRDDLKTRSQLEFLNLSKPPPRLKVLVATSEIREAGPTDIITRLHLKINEEAFEWTTVENSNGEKNEKLISE